MPYNSPTRTINAPVGIADVASCLGCTTDLGTCCTYPTINPWAKYKPEAAGGPGGLTLDQRKDNNFGLAPSTVYSSKTALLTAVANGSFTGGWTYTKPVPGTHWMRLTDFINAASPAKTGYNANAQCPFGTLMPVTAYLAKSQDVHLMINADAPDTGDGLDDNGCLSLADFRNGSLPLKDWYFGVLLYKSTSQYFFATSQTPVGLTSDRVVDFGWVNPAYAGEYKGIPVLSSVPWTQGGAEQPCRIIGLAQTGVTIELKTTEDLTPMSATAGYQGAYVVAWSVSITNASGSAKTFGNLRLSFAQSLDGTNASDAKTFGNVTVDNGKTWSQSGTIQVSSMMYVACKLISTQQSTEWMPMEQIDQPETPPEA